MYRPIHYLACTVKACSHCNHSAKEYFIRIAFYGIERFDVWKNTLPFHMLLNDITKIAHVKTVVRILKRGETTILVQVLPLRIENTRILI